MKYLNVLLLGFILISASACKSSKDLQANGSIFFQQTACFGACPIHHMTITTDGKVKYEGERFTKKLGSFTKQLDKSETRKLFEFFDSPVWNEYKSEYPTNSSDLPSTIIRFTYGKTNKKVIITGEHPSSLDVYVKRLTQIVESEGWVNQNVE